jgi:RNA-directed DNA polymerase
MTTELPQIKPTVGALSDLEHRLGVKRHDLAELLQSRPDLYSPFNLPKKQHPYPGKLRRLKALEPVKYRPIDNPVKQLKDIQKRILATILKRVELPAYLFGAVAGKTLLGHAEQHIQNQSSTVVRMDISSYYPNITCLHVYYVWHVVLHCPPATARLLTELTTFDYHLPQGAPTSPAIANIFLASIYAPVCLVSEKAGLTITTWVDDLIFSGAEARSVMETVRATLAANDFKMAPEKREIFGPKDEKNFTGTRLGRFEVRVPHKKMSDLRAAIHRLVTGGVEPCDIDRYRKNLCARIAHIGTIHKGDAAKIRQHAARSGVALK